MRKLLLHTALIAAASSAIAADYQIKTVELRPIESYATRVALDGITVAADPYDTDEKSFTAFDVRDLNSRGYHPVHVILKNDTAGYLSLSTRTIVLETAAGQTLYTTPATIVVEDVVKAGFLSKLPKMGSIDPATSTRTGSPLLDFTGKELTNRNIEPGALIHGFLFFFTQGSKERLLASAKLLIPSILEEGSRKKIGPFVILLTPGK
jgi:hypothetical protein